MMFLLLLLWLLDQLVADNTGNKEEELLNLK
jgi:hypothetical protein